MKSGDRISVGEFVFEIVESKLPQKMPTSGGNVLQFPVAQANAASGMPAVASESPSPSPASAIDSMGVAPEPKKLHEKALKAFDERPDYLSIESNKVDLAEVQKELNVLSALGYEKFMAVQQADIPNRRMSTVDLSGKPFTFVFASAECPAESLQMVFDV